MIRIKFESNEIARLREISQNHPHPHIRAKASALTLKSQNIQHYKIAASIGISANTLRTYFKQYVEGGIDSITKLNFREPKSKLVEFEDMIKNYLNETPPASIKQACEEIEKRTGIKLCETQMRKYLKSLGVKFRKVGGIPAKADVEKQKNFLEKELQPRLDEAKDGKRDVYFVDAAHFVLGAFLGFLWSFTRIFVKTPSGRQRFNVLGALNAISKELITITNTTYITSTQVCELLKKIALTKNQNPITLVLDNARYQRCDLVVNLAKELGIELLFLPPYSPNLNLIERVWKFTKKQCLNSKYYSDFNLFKNAISSFLLSMHQVHATKLKTLLTLEFQLFSKEQIDNVI
jgi:transposase